MADELTIGGNKPKKSFLTFLKNFLWLIVSIVWGIIFIYTIVKKNDTHNREIRLLETAFNTREDMLSNNMAILFRQKDSIKGELILQRQLNLDLKSAYDLELITNTNLRNELSQVKVVTITKIDSIFIPYKDTNYLDTKSIIRVPKPFSLSNEYFAIAGEVRWNGVIATPSVKNMQTITIGEARPEGMFGFLKKSVPVVEIKNANPYSQTIEMSNVVIIQSPPKWYETRFFQISAGFGVGLIVGLIAK